VRPAEEPLPLTFEVRAGRVIVRQGEPYPGAWIVRSGRLLMETVDTEGRRLALDLLGRGDLVGGPPGWTADASVTAAIETWLAPAGPAAIREGLTLRAHRVTALACALAWDPVPDRVAARFDDLAERFGRPARDAVGVRIPLTQEEIASLTGSTRESVNRALATLRRRGRLLRVDDVFLVRREGSAATRGEVRARTPA
jgi:CRP/FNR family cyclic AMP-dependent transcriptional regulator